MARRLLLVFLMLAASIFAISTPAYADTCGDTSAQWVPTLGSTWSGTFGSDDLTVAFVQTANVAATVVDIVPVVGEWAYGAPFEWNGATEGFEYFFQVNATDCANGKVTAAEGTGYDGLQNAYHVSMTRTF